jgi:hypothetical protein
LQDPGLAFDQILGIGDDTHAGDVILERDVPEPSSTPTGVRSTSVAPPFDRFAMGSLEVEKSSLLEPRIPYSPSKLVGEHGALSGGIDYHLRMKLLN